MRQVTPYSIAILPFLNLSADPNQDYFSDGMTEEVINALTKVKGLQVTARTSSFAFKGKKMDVRTIGQQLGVSTILEGSVRIVDKKVRITAQLINVTDGFHFWSETFDRVLNDIFAVQDEISLLIAEKLREHTGHFDIVDQLVAHPGVSIPHYKKYLRGRYLLHRFNKVDVQAGMSIMKGLTKEVPKFPLPYLGLNIGYTFLTAMGLISAEEANQRGKTYLNRALALDDQLPECQLRLAGWYYWVEWEFAKSYHHIKKALELRPGYAEAHLWLGVSLATEGRFKAAHQSMDTALQLDPFSTLIQYFKGAIHYFEEKYELANHYFDQALQFDNQYIMAHINKAATLLLVGKLEEGLQMFQTPPATAEGDIVEVGGSTLAYAMMGNYMTVDTGIQQLKNYLEGPLEDRALFFLALTYTVLGQFEEAIQLIETGIQKRLPSLIALRIEPFLKPLHAHPKWVEMMDTLCQPGVPISLDVNSTIEVEEALNKLDNDFHILEDWMHEKMPYLDPKLNLRLLAKQLDFHPNYLSKLINKGTGKNFSEFTNTYRLETFKTKAQNPANHHLTLLGLAYESGFSSKTVFNTFFKKQLGLTPREYWRHLVGKTQS